MIKFVYFDVAQTLLHKPDVWTGIEGVLRNRGHAIPLPIIRTRHRIVSELVRFPDRTDRTFYDGFNTQFLLALGLSPEAGLAEAIFEACTYKPWVPFEDTAFIDGMEGRVGILSNWDSSLSSKLAQHFSRSFDIILGSQDIGVQKPDPGLFRMAVERTGLRAEEVLFVGDSIRLDYMPAEAAGIRSVLIDREDDYPYFNGRRIRSFHELPRFMAA